MAQHNRHVMFDLETWDVEPSAVIRACAVIHFDSTGKVHKQYLIDCRPSIDDQLECGRTIRPSTVKWWRKQKHPLSSMLDKYPAHAIKKANQVEQMLDTLREALSVLQAPSKAAFWSRGSFDAQIIEHLFQQFDVAVPWSFRKLRDVRTLDEVIPVPLRDESLMHDPLADCANQIKQVSQFLHLRL